MVKKEKKLNVIYEDNHVLVVEKIPNILSQSDNTNDIDMLTMCKDYIKKKYNKPGNVYLGLVHRLDRPVGGVMVFAKTSKAASRLSDQVRTRKMKKTYRAIVFGKCEKSGCFNDYLLKDKKKNIVSISKKGVKDSKGARLSYNFIDSKVLKDKQEYSLVDINLETGRPHQIRVQFSSRNHSLYGDQKYSKYSKVGQQLALWAVELSFIHPTTKEEMRFNSTPSNEYPWNIYNNKNLSYGGFYIDTPVGNNKFSYFERKSKSIYVPELVVKKNSDAIEISDKPNFIEVDEGNEILCYGLKNMYEFNIKGKKIFLFDNHNHAFFFWCKSLLDGFLKKASLLVHIDQHKDTRTPSDFSVDIDDLDDVKKYTNEILNVGNFIKPALYHRIFKELMIVDSDYSLDLDIPDKYVLDIDLDFFSKDMDYIDFNKKISKTRQYILGANLITVATSPYFIEQERAIKVFKILFDF